MPKPRLSQIKKSLHVWEPTLGIRFKFIKKRSHGDYHWLVIFMPYGWQEASSWSFWLPHRAGPPSRWVLATGCAEQDWSWQFHGSSLARVKKAALSRYEWMVETLRNTS